MRPLLRKEQLRGQFGLLLPHECASDGDAIGRGDCAGDLRDLVFSCR
jgi:hypothetical protein